MVIIFRGHGADNFNDNVLLQMLLRSRIWSWSASQCLIPRLRDGLFPSRTDVLHVRLTCCARDVLIVHLERDGKKPARNSKMTRITPRPSYCMLLRSRIWSWSWSKPVAYHNDNWLCSFRNCLVDILICINRTNVQLQVGRLVRDRLRRGSDCTNISSSFTFI
jgi:hypothetical protein